MLTVTTKKELDILTKNEVLLNNYKDKVTKLSNKYMEEIMDSELNERLLKLDEYVGTRIETMLETKEKIIINMYQNKIPISTISKCVDLSIKEIKNIIKQLQNS